MKQLLWKELFCPSTIEPIKPTFEEMNQAWNWIFSGNHAGLALTVIRNASLGLRRSGVTGKTGDMAIVGVWKRIKANSARISVPKRLE